MPELIPADQKTEDHAADCVAAALSCARVCLETVMHHCLKVGGRHAEAHHVGLMLGCSEICHATAQYLTATPVLQAKVCSTCAEVCEACAYSCTQIGDMDVCVEHCRRCADLCRRMMTQAAAQAAA